jgi:predicted N-acetyltransferase YhbS
MTLALLSPADEADLARLLDRCFGPARARRTAALVRAGAPRIPGASLVDRRGGSIVGAVQTHAVGWRMPGRTARRLAWLGPLVSDPDRRGEGIGLALMESALAALEAEGWPVALIGDLPYYARWGFGAEATGEWRLPGPVDRARLLLRAPHPAAWAGPASLAAEGLARAA